MGRTLGVVGATISTVAVIALAAAGSAAAAAPPNDTFPGTAIAGTTFSGTTDQATRQGSEPVNVSGDTASVWYTWTAPSNGLFTIDLCGAQTPTDTGLGVYVGGAVATLIPVAANDDAAQCEGAASSFASAVTFQATAATPYRVSVSGVGPGVGPFAGRIDPGPNTLAAGNNPAVGDSATGDSVVLGVVQGAASAAYTCTLDGGAPVGCDSALHMTALADGPHAVRVQATVAGQTDPTPAVWRFAVDRTAPDTQLISADLSTPSSPSFGFGATEAGGRFECSLNATTYAPCASPQGFAGLCSGSDAFAVRATDAAGNVDPTPAVQAFSVPSGVCGTPSVTTDALTAVGDYYAAVYGTVNVAGGAAAMTVQYGPTTSYGFESPPILVAGVGSQQHSASVFGAGGTVVHYRAVARTGTGLVFAGDDRTVTLGVPPAGAPVITVGTPVVTSTTIDLPYTATVSPPVATRKSSSAAVLVMRTPPSSFQFYADLNSLPGDGQPHSGTLHVGHLAPGTTVELLPAVTDGSSSRVESPGMRMVTTAAADAGDGGAGASAGPAPAAPIPPTLPPVVPAGPPVKTSPLGKVSVGALRRATLRKGRWSVTVVCTAACRIQATLTSGTTVVARGSGRRTSKGTLKLKFTVTKAGKKLLGRKAKLALTVSATDPLGLTLGAAKRTLTFR